MLIELTQPLLLLFFGTGLLAGTVDAIAGGGGLISLPVLLTVGLPPQVALGTNKIQTSVGTFVATYSYYRQGWFSFKTVYKGLIFGFLGAVMGALLSQMINNAILNKIIPLLLFIILIYTLLSPKLGKEDIRPRWNEYWFYVVFGFMLGFYDGFFGPGTGSFWVFCLSFFLGYNLIKATAYTKVFNLKSNLIAATCFALGQHVDYRIAFCMAAGQLIGGRLGAVLAIKNGAALIRPIFMSMVTLLILSLVYKNYVTTSHFSLLSRLLFITCLLIFFSIILFSFAKKFLNRSKLSFS
ncbi:MAG: TSUP family transporter [Gammaproteobacteria bacterium]|nr:TSUP family transporter [Gammaproteobacteria bacterium]